MILQAQQPSLDPSKMIPVILVWFLAMVLSLILISKKKLTKFASILILAVTFVVSGIIFGAQPNPVMPIQSIILGINMGVPLKQILSMFLTLLVLIVSTLLFGRVFCGYACPLGALQELMSKFQFKSSLKAQRNKKNVPLNTKIATYIRMGYFIVFVSAGIIWGASVVQYLNIFAGFQVFKKPVFPMIAIPALLLSIIGITSRFVYRPWCRLFCPFGTLAGITSRFSLYKLRRTDACTDCGLCERICPTQEANRDSTKEECYLCNRCVDICPQDAIEYSKK